MHNCFKETAETFLSSTGLKLPVDYSVDVDKRKGIYLQVNTESFLHYVLVCALLYCILKCFLYNLINLLQSFFGQIASGPLF